MTCVVCVLGVTLLVMYAIKMIRGTWTLRISKDGELEGMDIHEHGTPAYHVEFGQGMTYSSPPNLPRVPGNGVHEAVTTDTAETPV
jgi:hypothetical protein